ncbi:hypothetical protein RFI_31333, partial [Reticulomyxa filosa]
MNYVSVWTKKENKNKWLPFVSKSRQSKIFAGNQDSYLGACALISGSNNNLLFITYRPKNILVFDLNKFKFINETTLPIDNHSNNYANNMCYHCFILKNINEMILFCKDIGFSIQYNEINNTFQFQKLWIIISLFHKKIHKYFIIEDKWMKFDKTLPQISDNCIAILSEDNMYVHILGGRKSNSSGTHIMTKVDEWFKAETKEEMQWMENEKERREFEQVKMDIEMKEHENKIQKLKRMEEIEIIITHWIRLEFVKMIWPDDLNKIVARYILMKYFKLIKEYRGHFGSVTSVSFSPDNSKLISSSSDATIRIWDKSSGKELKILKGHSEHVSKAQFSPDGSKIISSSYDKTIRLWDVQSELQLIKLEGNSNCVTAQWVRSQPLFFKKNYTKNFLNINNMDNQTITQNDTKKETEQNRQLTTHSQTLKELSTTQNSPETETVPSQQINTHFQTFKKLPTPLSLSQCVQHKHELLICGGLKTRACYSYHTLKNEYNDVELTGHCVVKLVDRNSNNDKYNNQITLLSFGSDYDGNNKHTLVMKY